MKPTMYLGTSMLLLVSACGAPDEAAVETASGALVGGCASVWWGRDDDRDGIDDGQEQCVLETNAPMMQLDRIEQRLPANVDWYLARTDLRFHHNNCSDCGITGTPDQSLLGSPNAYHQKKKGLFGGCGHDNNKIVWMTAPGAFDVNQLFFLELRNDGDRNGSWNPADWIVYGHVYRNQIGGVNAQYWAFYPYSDNTAFDNHEGDWEMVTVRRRADGSVDGVFICAHGQCPKHDPRALEWTGQHPHIWVANGTHGSYADQATCDEHETDPNDSCDFSADHRWFTWPGGKGGEEGFQGGGVVNVGEKKAGEAPAPMNGQTFILGNIRWGEIGSSQSRSGPPGPAFQNFYLD